LVGAQGERREEVFIDWRRFKKSHPWKLGKLLTFDPLRLINVPGYMESSGAASQDHNEDNCGPVYASEITGIRFLLKAKTRLWQFRLWRFSRGDFHETWKTWYQPAGAASDRIPASRKEA